MKANIKKILYLLVGVSAVFALLGLFNISLGIPTIVTTVGGYLLIAGGLLWGLKALGKEVF